METLIAGSDFHFRFQSQESVKAFLKTIKREKPQVIVIAGDLLDEYALSKFTKNANVAGIKEEIGEAKKFLKELRLIAPKAKIIFILGNHDSRLELRFLEKMPEAHGLITLSGLLDCKELGIETIGGFEKPGTWQWHDVLFGHWLVARKHSGQTALALLQEKMMNIAVPHVHRQGLVRLRTWDKQLWAAEMGCLCGLNPGYAERPNWQNGFLIVRWDGKKSWPELVEIDNGKTLQNLARVHRRA